MKPRVLFGLAWLCFACAGTETDNPVADRDDDGGDTAQDTPPTEYTSPTDFDAPTGGSSGSGCDSLEQGRGFVWHRVGELLIGADTYHGLVTIDISDPEAPMLLGEQVFDDDLLVLSLELLLDEGQPREAVLAARATPRINSDELPNAQDLQAVDQILRFDLSDPANPELIESWTLEGLFRGLVVDGDLAWVMTSYDSQYPEVPYCPFHSWCDTPDTLRVEGFRITGDGWESESEVLLPTDSHAWLSEEGVTGLRFVDTDSVLHFARFDGTAIGTPMVVTVEDVFGGRPLQTRLTTNELQVVTQVDTAGGRTLRLLRFALSEDGPGEPEVTDLGRPEYNGSSGAYFSGDHLFVNLGRDNLEARVFELAESGTTELDLGVPTQVVVPLAALQASGDADPDLVGTAPTKALAWRGDPGAVADVLSLVSIDGTDVTTLDDWEIPSESLIEANIEGYEEQLGFLQPHQVKLHGSYLTAHDQGRRGRLSALRIEGDSLVSVGSVDTDFVHAELAAGDDYFLVTPFGVQAANFESGETSEHRYTDEVFLHTAVGGFEATLLRVEPYPRSRFELRLTRGGESWSFPMEHQPLALLPSDEALILPVLDPTCEEEDDDCVPQQPYLLMVSLTDPPRLLDPIPMPLVFDELTVETSEGELSWLFDYDRPLLRLNDGRWVFTAEAWQGCDSEAECEELGAEARYNESEDYWRGVLRTRYFFALDTDQDGGSFGQPALSAIGDQVTGFGDSFVSDRQLLVQRLQNIEQTDDGPRQVRVFVDRFDVDADGEFSELPGVNIPGRAIGVLPDGQLLSVEPRPGTGGGGTLYRVRLDDDSALVEDSLDIDGSYVSLHLASDTAVYVSEPSELCGGPRVLSTLSVLPNLALESQVTLGEDWLEWDVKRVELPYVLLERENGGHLALFELDDGEATLRSVRPTRCDGYGSFEWTGEQLSCAAGGFGVEQIEF